ncbi:MAG: hypothetical protein FD174_2243 [Geobacteraceae bacterium]|nr:MAG: hypothetical protein FD174_2243 [Geobacteraceae bacterium]
MRVNLYVEGGKSCFVKVFTILPGIAYVKNSPSRGEVRDEFLKNPLDELAMRIICQAYRHTIRNCNRCCVQLIPTSIHIFTCHYGMLLIVCRQEYTISV